MNKFIAFILCVAFAGTAFAQTTCTGQLGNVFTPAQASKLCASFGSSITNSLIPRADVTYDLGSASKQWKALYLGQTLAGSLETVAGAGTTVADAAQLSATKIVHQITGANGTVGWKMSASMPTNSVQILLNTTAGVAKIYAESGGTVNGGSADAAFSALTGVKPIICFKTAALTYICS